MRNIVAIAANTNPTRYIMSTFKRLGDTIGAELTDDKNSAKDFGTVDHANDVIKKLFNPFDRFYSAVPMQVLQPAHMPCNEELN